MGYVFAWHRRLGLSIRADPDPSVSDTGDFVDFKSKGPISEDAIALCAFPRFRFVFDCHRSYDAALALCDGSL